MKTALKSRSQKDKSASTEEKFDLNPRRVWPVLMALNFFWLMAILYLNTDKSYSQVFSTIILLGISLTEYYADLSISFNKEFLQSNIGKLKFRLLWNEIQNAEMSEKQDRLVIFSGHDKRIAFSQLNGIPALRIPALRERLVKELTARSIPITTTKRASYYETKNSEFRKATR